MTIVPAIAAQVQVLYRPVPRRHHQIFRHCVLHLQHLGLLRSFFSHDNEAVLGFERQYAAGTPPVFAMVSRDGLAIMLRFVPDPARIFPNE